MTCGGCVELGEVARLVVEGGPDKSSWSWVGEQFIDPLGEAGEPVLGQGTGRGNSCTDARHIFD